MWEQNGLDQNPQPFQKKKKNKIHITYQMHAKLKSNSIPLGMHKRQAPVCNLLDIYNTTLHDNIYIYYTKVIFSWGCLKKKL